MDFFDKIQNAGKGVAQKTKDLAEIAKLNSRISNEEENIKTAYSQIGELYFKIFSESPDERFAALCNVVKQAQANIKEYTRQIQAIKGVKSCPNCGAEIANTAAFCSVCGADARTAAEEQEIKTSDGKKVCPKCGASVSENAVFCGNCGNKIG